MAFRIASRPTAVLTTLMRAPVTVAARHLSVHEYASQDLLRKYGVSIPAGYVASTPQEAYEAAKKLDSEDIIVKAQVLAGGRGLGHFNNGFKGGVHKAYTPAETRELAEKMLGQRLITKQTGAEGRPCDKVLVCQRAYTRREMYLAIVMDRQNLGPVLVGSAQGGMDIESVAHENPDAIIKEPIDITRGPTQEQVARMVKALGFSQGAQAAAMDNVQKLYKFFIERDCTLLEVNPLAETVDGKVLCMDAKVNFDDNAEFRQKDVFKLRDMSQENAREVEAAKADLNYISLDGNIGCLVNGAGLAMATMDLISLHGGAPANFLDVGGGANEKMVTEAFRIITRDPKVEAVLVNIFGGIMRCDIIAMGIIAACKTLDIKVPLIVRLQGTRVDDAKALLEASTLRIISADDLDTAAHKAVQLSRIVRMAKEAHIGVSFQLPL